LISFSTRQYIPTLSKMNADINHTVWLDFISHQNNATIFHHPAWAGILEECYGYEANLITIGENKMVGVVPVMEVSNWLADRRVVSLPFSKFWQALPRQAARWWRESDVLIAKNKLGISENILDSLHPVSVGQILCSSESIELIPCLNCT
jgi:hypothetical protein